eukprot:g1547.t1
MQSCFRFLRNRAESGDKHAPQVPPNHKTNSEKAVLAALAGGPNFDSFSSSAFLNHTADSSQASEIHQRSLTYESIPQENENEANIDLDAAIRAVDVALAGLNVGGKRQSSPTAAKQQQQQQQEVQISTRSRPGCPPKSATLHGAIRRFAKFVTPNHPQQRASYQDPFTNRQQVSQYPSTNRRNSPEFMLNSGDMLNHQYSGHLGNVADIRSNFSESDMTNAAAAAALWAGAGTGGGGGGVNQTTSEEWNVQQQLQNLINHNQTLSAQNSITRNWSTDYSGNPPPPPQFTKQVMNNAISEFLMRSNDSLSSKIEVPNHHRNGSGRGDSFSSRIEFPINCDSFSSKLSTASIRDESFSSQRVMDPLLLNNGRSSIEPMMSPAIETGYNLPELIRQELESLAEGDVAREVPESAVVHVQSEAHLRSEKTLLLAISGILRCALIGTFDASDLLSNLNFLLVSVRRHFMDYHNFSSNAAESFLLIGSTLPVVCLAARFNEDLMASLRKFMMMISSGHPSLNNAARILEFNPVMEVQSTQSSNEAYQLLTKIHQRLSTELNITNNNNNNQTMPSAQSTTSFMPQEMTSHGTNVGLGNNIQPAETSSDSVGSKTV